MKLKTKDSPITNR
ncbi:hypothetical protein OIU79_015675, partial [Salix purpurea]